MLINNIPYVGTSEEGYEQGYQDGYSQGLEEGMFDADEQRLQKDWNDALTAVDDYLNGYESFKNYVQSLSMGAWQSLITTCLSLNLETGSFDRG